VGVVWDWLEEKAIMQNNYDTVYCENPTKKMPADFLFISFASQSKTSRKQGRDNCKLA
jgi:hypothetical protein